MNNHKVTINWYGEVLTFYTHAKDKKVSLSNAIVQLSILVGRTKGSVRCYVTDSQHDRWKVEVLK